MTIVDKPSLDEWPLSRESEASAAIPGVSEGEASRSSRKAFQRLSQDQRRRDLLEATLSCVAQHGLAGASVRRVAEAAGVSPGLIRHHFGTKDDMVRAAYAYMMGQLTSDIADASPVSDESSACRLARFIAASLTQPESGRPQGLPVGDLHWSGTSRCHLLGGPSGNLS